MVDDIFTFIGATVNVRVDRPMGSRHPKYDFVYPVNYGHLPDTEAPDRGEIDVYVLGVDSPIEGEFTGKAIAVIHRSDDNDDKLVVVPEDHPGLTDAQIRELTDFQEQYYSSVIMRIQPEE